MATKQKKGGGGGAGGAIKAGIAFVLAISFVVGWAKANNIDSVNSALDYFRTWSSEVDNCMGGEIAWNCETPIPGLDGSKKNKGENKPNVQDATPSQAMAMLDSITIANSKDVEYSRKDWKHWSDPDGNGCNARMDTLKRDGKDVKTDGPCKVISGVWEDQYAPETITDPGKIDIDHMVPLSWAARNGGQKMSAEMKETFANDPDNLFISLAKENRAKGDKGPGDYLPPNKAFQCEYVTSFVAIVSKYDLSMPKSDANAARKVLSSCS